jgi:hypothetical protein
MVIIAVSADLGLAEIWLIQGLILLFLVFHGSRGVLCSEEEGKEGQVRTGESKVRGGIRALVGFVALAVMAASPALAGTEAQIKIEQAKVQFSAKNYQEALTLLDAAVAEEPDNAEAYHYAGLCQLLKPATRGHGRTWPGPRSCPGNSVTPSRRRTRPWR